MCCCWLLSSVLLLSSSSSALVDTLAAVYRVIVVRYTARVSISLLERLVNHVSMAIHNLFGEKQEKSKVITSCKLRMFREIL